MDAAYYRTPRPDAASTTAGLALFDAVDVPDIRTPLPVAPGSASSDAAASTITEPMRARSYRAVMLALAASGPLTRDQLEGVTGIKGSTLCARLADLRPTWVIAYDRAGVSSAGVRVDTYGLTDAGRARVRGAA